MTPIRTTLLQQRDFKPAMGLLGLFLSACASIPLEPSSTHLEPPPAPTTSPQTPADADKAPGFVSIPVLPKPPKPTAKPELYSVVVHHMNAQELLFALARDAKLNIDIHPDISGTVTMNLLDQTLTEILDRVAGQVDMRYELNGKNLSILPDSPYLKTYRVDYPNIQRNAQSSVSTSTNIAASGAAPTSSSSSSSGGSGGSGNNSSTTSIQNIANNRFWDTLIANLRDLLRETDKLLPEGSSETVTEQAGQLSSTPQSAATPPTTSSAARTPTNLPAQMDARASTTVRRTTFREAASVISNPETGVISVRATRRQHEKIREFLDRIMGSARRQVLIEATIVEVDLSDRYQQGIDWTMVRTAGNTAGTGMRLAPVGPGSGLLTGGMVSGLATLSWRNTFGNSDVTAALRLLESFGTLRVLSSPKISVLNSQTSVLKVVDNEVYFTINVTPGTAATATSPATPTTYSTTLNTVPIGFLMTLTPQISDNGEVILNLRPTISRITGYAMDPNPALAEYSLNNPIPIVQTREMESILRVQNGDIAILGGLMQDSRNAKVDAIPGAFGRMPLLGDLFSFKDTSSRKSELVVFLRPTILTDASLEGDFRAYRDVLSEARSAFKAPLEPVRP